MPASIIKIGVKLMLNLFFFQKKEDDEGMGDLPLKSVRKRRVRKD